MIRESRSFFSGQTMRQEIWLDRIKLASLENAPNDPKIVPIYFWLVVDIDGKWEQYPDTDEGYAEARADYETRVTARIQATAELEAQSV